MCQSSWIQRSTLTAICICIHSPPQLRFLSLSFGILLNIVAGTNEIMQVETLAHIQKNPKTPPTVKKPQNPNQNNDINSQQKQYQIKRANVNDSLLQVYLSCRNQLSDKAVGRNSMVKRWWRMENTYPGWLSSVRLLKKSEVASEDCAACYRPILCYSDLWPSSQ